MTRAAILLAALAVPALAADPPRPHVVFFVADDLGTGDVGYNGGEIKTPHIDRLADAGAKLSAFYVQPVCSPTRAALMTGRYPIRHGLQVGVVRPWAQYGLPLEERTLPQALKEAGYATAIVGKWHLGHFKPDYLPTRRGFDRQYGHYNGALDYFTHDRDGGHDWHRDDRVNRDEGYATHLLAREACKIVADHDAKKPLFLYVPFNAVHSPHQVPEKYKAPYAAFKEPRRTYAGMLAAMDEAIGQVVAAVEKKGLHKDTLFVFTSDNGGPQPGTVTSNGKLRAGKGTVYEGGVRVAAFAAWDGQIRPGSVVTEPLHIVDWYPTLLKLAAASLDQKLPLDGLDAWATVADGKPTPHKEILLNATPTGGGIRVGDWKLVLNGGRDAGDNPAPKKKKAAPAPAVELFHLAEDPSESKNLAADKPDKVAELRARYDHYARAAVPPKARPKPADFKSPKVWGEPD
jgi:arylsulfatase A-like enzyme